MSNTLQVSKPREPRPGVLNLMPWTQSGMLDVARLFDSFLEGDFTTDTPGARMDVAETDQAVEVLVDLPGVSAKDIDIRVENNMLVIRGQRKEEHEQRDPAKQFHRIERRFGSFSRSLMLPTSVNDSEAVAEFNDGVLKIVLPKAESAKSHKINIK